MRTTFILIAVLLVVVFSVGAQRRKENLDSVVKGLKLKEVVVSAKKVKQKGDTISYSAATYRSPSDKTLSDLLRKMPGIEVKDDGQVMYNGQWIKEFYIEGMNMLGDNYGVATNNIDAKAIGTVEVMQNHQDVKMLRGVEKGTAPAMNIKLKEDAKGVWTGTLDASAGAQPRFSWDVAANLMTFRRRAQNISVFKTDNTGNDLRKEINAPQTFNGSLGTSLLSPGRATLDNRYAYLNTSYSLSVNQLFRIKENRFLTFNANYLHDKERRETDNITTYLTDSLNRYVFDELSEATMRQHFGGVNAVYKINSSDTYLKNTLSANISFPDGEGVIGEALHQKLSGHSLSITDNFEFKHRKIGGGIGDTKARFSYTEREGDLGVPERFLDQNLLQRRLRMSASTSLIAVTAPYTMFNLNFGAEGERQEVRNSLDLPAAEEGRMVVWQTMIKMTPNLLLHRGQKVQWNINVPIGAMYYSSAEGSWRYHKMFLSLRPSTYLSYRLTDCWDLMLTLKGEEEMPTALGMMAQSHYSDYRSVYSNPDRIEIKPDRTLKGGFSVGYKSVLDMMFGSAGISYYQTKYGTSMGYDIEDGMVVYQRLPFSTRADGLRLDQTFSKGFFRGNSKIGEEISLSTGSTEYYVGEELHTGRNVSFRGKLTYRMAFARWIAFDTANELTLTGIYTDGSKDGHTRNTFTSLTSFELSPVRQLFIIPSVMYYHNNYSTSYRDNVFLNCKVEYTVGRVVLTLQGCNLLDSRVFRRFTDNGIISRSNEYHLRGRMMLVGVRIKI